MRVAVKDRPAASVAPEDRSQRRAKRCASNEYGECGRHRQATHALRVASTESGSEDLGERLFVGVRQTMGRSAPLAATVAAGRPARFPSRVPVFGRVRSRRLTLDEVEYRPGGRPRTEQLRLDPS